MTSTGAPFWRLVETIHDESHGQSETARAEAARLEAALDAAGLLQAWVTPDGAYLADRDGNETVWAPASSAALPGLSRESSLRSVLRPADDAGGLANVVERLLGLVAYDVEIRDAAAADSGLRGQRRGCDGGRPLAARRPHRCRRPGPGRPPAAWRRRQGRRPTTPGHAAPGADRGPGDERTGLSADDLTVVQDLLQMLEDVGMRLPADTGVVSAILTVRETAKRVGRLATASDRADKAEQEARKKADSAAADVASHCDEHHLPRTRDEVDELSAALAGYLNLLTELEVSMRPIESLRRALHAAETTLQAAHSGRGDRRGRRDARS